MNYQGFNKIPLFLIVATEIPILNACRNTGILSIKIIFSLHVEDFIRRKKNGG